MRLFTGISILALALAGCSDADTGEAAADDEVAAEAGADTANGGASDAEAADAEEVAYDIPPAVPGLEWFLDEGGDYSSAIYGPPNAGGVILISCSPQGLEMVLQDVDGLAGREVATVRSGPHSGSFDTTFSDEGMSLLRFDVPVSHPVVERLASDGFRIDLPNGESNPFPPSEKIGKALSACGK